MNKDGKSELFTNQAIPCHVLAKTINISNLPYTGDIKSDNNEVENPFVTACSLECLLMVFDPI